MHPAITRALILLLAAYILFGPALVQVLQRDLPLVRSWQMYGTVGVGAPYGNFEILENGSTVASIPIAEALGLSRTSELQLYPGSGSMHRYFHDPSEFAETAAPLCAALESNQTIRFFGRVAGRRGWNAVELDHKRLCPSG